jgi:surfactin synthase thioesterase subunit
VSVVDTASSTDWVRRFHPSSEATTRLVCFAHAGGSASFFHPLSARFSPVTDVVSLQYPGRQDRHREPCVDDIGELADRVTAELSGLPPLPTVFFGHSMGALVGFETARRLEARDDPAAPRALLASGRRAPGTHRAGRPDGVHRFDDRRLLRELELLGGPDMAALDEEFLALALPAIRADYRAVESYGVHPDAEVGCPVVALTGEDDPRTTVDEADAWRRHTRGDFSIQVYPGGHFFLVDHAAAVGGEIGRWLDAAAR